jgi:hypothetical protein
VDWKERLLVGGTGGVPEDPVKGSGEGRQVGRLGNAGRRQVTSSGYSTQISILFLHGWTYSCMCVFIYTHLVAHST